MRATLVSAGAQVVWRLWWWWWYPLLGGGMDECSGPVLVGACRARWCLSGSRVLLAVGR